MSSVIPTTRKDLSEDFQTKQEELLYRFSALPPELQQQVMDFIAFLQARYLAIQPAGKARKTPLAREPFIGIWRDRPDMEDSTGWVRGIRLKEWEETGA